MPARMERLSAGVAIDANRNIECILVFRMARIISGISTSCVQWYVSF